MPGPRRAKICHGADESVVVRSGSDDETSARPAVRTDPEPTVEPEHVCTGDCGSGRAVGDAGSLLPPGFRADVHGFGAITEDAEPGRGPTGLGRDLRATRRPGEQSRRPTLRSSTSPDPRQRRVRQLLGSVPLAIGPRRTRQLPRRPSPRPARSRHPQPNRLHRTLAPPRGLRPQTVLAPQALPTSDRDFAESWRLARGSPVESWIEAADSRVSQPNSTTRRPRSALPFTTAARQTHRAWQTGEAGRQGSRRAAVSFLSFTTVGVEGCLLVSVGVFRVFVWIGFGWCRRLM